MNQQETMEKSLLSEIDGYLMNLVYLKDLIEVEKSLAEASVVNEFAPNFSLITQCALYDSYMLCLMKLYDKSEKAKTIPNLIRKCKNNVTLFRSPDEVSKRLVEWEEKINSDKFITPTIKTLRMRRDQYHVHNDKKYFGEKIVNDTSHLKNYHILILRDFTEEILFYLWNQLTDEKHRETKYNDDLKNLLEKV